MRTKYECSLWLCDLLGLLPLSALVLGGQCVTDGAFRLKEEPAIEVQLFF